ncbi:unnamed protein product [Spirodela intermedia]|uniref:SBP-type domain-containing protein n=1 Tax=Spirodela intermedia TaxID=51605 RepID=A0A7I8IWV3_SPIIN|nr:unnamed protein product [Spirodela intermedia]CAA6661631.1 unnamed protein product [Spirodela intermedia]
MIGSAYPNTPGNWNPKSWDWDSARFVARPASSVSGGALLGTPSPVAEREEKGTREESLTSLGLAKVSEVAGESLTLKLGGGSHPVEEAGGRSGKRVRSGSPGNGGNYPMCQVDDCKADLSSAKDYHRRHKVCEIHSKTTKAMVGSQMQRFCQQCSRFHSLGEFDEGKRSCRRRLAGHNRRRRKTQPKDISSPLVYPAIQGSYGGGNLNIVDLLTILTRLQGEMPSSIIHLRLICSF